MVKRANVGPDTFEPAPKPHPVESYERNVRMVRPKMIRKSYGLPADLNDAIVKTAGELGVSDADVVRMAMREWLTERGKLAPK